MGSDRADARRSNARPEIGHWDWSANHFRYLDGAITAVYDWDSLKPGSEAAIVAGAASLFTVSWCLATKPVWATPEESLAFTHDCRKVRGRPFSSTEWSEWKATLTYSPAYNARVDQSVGATDAIPNFESTLSALSEV